MVDYGIQTGLTNRGLRSELVDAIVKQTAEPLYKFKQAVAIVSTSSWTNTFFREDPTVLTGIGTGAGISNIPRGANFPQLTPKWEEVAVKIVKHGAEDSIPWEDIISGTFDIQARIVMKLTQAIVKSVDDDIYNSLSQNNCTDSNLRVQSYAITGAAYWNVSSGAIIDDLLNASRLIAEKNYDATGLKCFVSPKQKQYIMTYLVGKGSQFPTLATSTAENGNIGRLAGVDLVETNSLTSSFAIMLKPKTCATWKELVSLRSTTIEDPYKSLKIRVVEEGKIELTDPLAICVIKGTHA